MLALPPDVVHWVSRNGQDGDCAIAAISLATGASYEAVLAEAIQVRSDAVTVGLNWREIRTTIKRLGFSSRLRRKYDLDEDTGILDCKRGRQEHVVYLWEGRIVEPRWRSMWRDPEAFLKHEDWAPGMLLTLKKD